MSQKDLYKLGVNCFRPQQGLTIMNFSNGIPTICANLIGFRPQQGLTIMNSSFSFLLVFDFAMFPSPTGVNYYE